MTNVGMLSALVSVAALSVASPAVADAEPEPGEGKKKRLPKPTQHIEQGPMTRQQRRYAERAARKGLKGQSNG